MRILVSVWPGLGDIMFSTPLLRALRRSFPQAFTAVASFLAGPGRELLETNPHIDEVFFPKDPFFTRRGLKEALDWARSRSFTHALEISQPAWWFFRLAGIKRWERFGKRAFWWFAPYRNKDEMDLHASEHFIRAAERLLGPLQRDEGGYDLYLTDKDERKAAEVLGGFYGGRFICVHPGARCNANKRWAIGKFTELSRRLSEEASVGVVVVGGEDDLALGVRIQEELGERCLLVAGSTTLRETAAVIKRSLLYLGNDSGPIQIAASVNVPIVGIYASSSPENFGPICRKKRIVTPEEKCAPCLRFPGYMWLPWGLRLRYYNRCKAMEGIGVDAVFRACIELLENTASITD